MRFQQFAFVFLTPSFSPERNTISTSSPTHRFKAVGIDPVEKWRVLDVAKELHAEGYQMIELCGGFGPQWAYRVSEALNYSVPIGGVYYGPEYRQQLVDIFKEEPKLIVNE